MQKRIAATIEEYEKNKAEHHLLVWENLKNGKFLNTKFHRCFPIYFNYKDQKKYILVDFYSPDHDLIIEFDEGLHNLQPHYDFHRMILEEHFNYKVIRFQNWQIIQELDEVMFQLSKILIRLHIERKSIN